MSTYKGIRASDIRTTKSFLNQLVDVVALDVSSSAAAPTRKLYQVFVTGGIGPGVTSSLYQTVFDQSHALQTSNPILDMTVGLFSGSSTVAGASTGQDSTGKLLFTSRSLMMREKINVYRQYAQTLLGDSTSQFKAPFGSATASDAVNEAIFINFKRLFSRDGIKRETFAMKFFQTGTMSKGEDANQPNRATLNVTSQSGSVIFTDVGSSQNRERSQSGGDVGNIVDSSNTNRTVGNIFYQHGIVMLDLSKIISGSQHVSGVIQGMNSATRLDAAPGQVIIGDRALRNNFGDGAEHAGVSGNINSTYIPDLMISGSIDDIVNHIASTRFGNGSTVAMTFQNETAINSTLIFCRAEADEFNFSSNPTYTDTEGRIRTVTQGNIATEKPFSFVTSVGLYNDDEALLAVAKLSRPVEKNEEKDITFRVRLDF